MADNQPQGRSLEAGGGRRSPVIWERHREKWKIAADLLTGAGEVAPGSPESPQGAWLRHAIESLSVLRPDEPGNKPATLFGVRVEWTQQHEAVRQCTLHLQEWVGIKSST